MTAALIFYPGAKVEAMGYLPILVKMPLNLVVLEENAADSAFASHPEISTWFASGHLMGGAMASAYASACRGELAGLVLFGAYVHGGYPPRTRSPSMAPSASTSRPKPATRTASS